MLVFEVKDMSCGHCVQAVTRALHEADRDAEVHIDLATHRVQVEPHSADAGTLAAAIGAAGYTPVPV